MQWLRSKIGAAECLLGITLWRYFSHKQIYSKLQKHSYNFSHAAAKNLFVFNEDYFVEDQTHWHLWLYKHKMWKRSGVVNSSAKHCNKKKKITNYNGNVHPITLLRGAVGSYGPLGHHAIPLAGLSHHAHRLLSLILSCWVGWGVVWWSRLLVHHGDWEDGEAAISNIKSWFTIFYS